MSNKLLAISAAFLSPCASTQLPSRTAPAGEYEGEIWYISGDLNRFMVFSDSGARSGDLSIPPSLRKPIRLRRVMADEGVQCMSVGPVGNSVEFAIKRPLRQGDHYSCLTSTFQVMRCFGNCHSAVIEVNAFPPDHLSRDARKKYMYVDECRGLLVHSDLEDLSGGVPLSAFWLRGDVGILADQSYPACRRNLEEGGAHRPRTRIQR